MTFGVTSVSMEGSPYKLYKYKGYYTIFWPDGSNAWYVVGNGTGSQSGWVADTAALKPGSIYYSHFYTY